MRCAQLLGVLACVVVACGEAERPCSELTTASIYAEALPCASDRLALATERSDAVFSHTRTLNVLLDREQNVAAGGRLYFINSNAFDLHYAFASTYLNLPGTSPVGTLAEFNLLNYNRAERRFVLMKLVEYVDADVLTLEWAAGDNADAAMITSTFAVVRVALGEGDRLRYRAVSRDQLARIGELPPSVPSVDNETLMRGQTYQALNPGVAWGTLRFVATANLGAAQLLPTDIVVLDRVPNDISMVSAIITSEFQTPLAHVGVLAKTRGTPNMALRDAWQASDLRQWDGQLVRLEVTAQSYAVSAGNATDAQAYWDSLRPSELQVPTHDSQTLTLFNVSAAGVAHASIIGNKAANLGELYRLLDSQGAALPLPAQPLAVPFGRYWQHVEAAGAGPLITAVVSDYRAGRLSPADLEARLFAVRWRLFSTPVSAQFLSEFRSIAASRWPVDTKLRFRSSTNVEDLPDFTGAGIYTSAGARLSDDDVQLGAAIKTVWASAWNSQAFIEREFYRVSHADVRMGILVHPAQSNELANGVALTINEFSERRPAFYINSQVLDIAVTNPTSGAVPEQLLYYTWYDQPEAEVIARSSLMAWASDPTAITLLSTDELTRLADVLTVIHTRMRTLYPGSVADVEWKLMPDHTILVKQARPFRPRL